MSKCPTHALAEAGFVHTLAVMSCRNWAMGWVVTGKMTRQALQEFELDVGDDDRDSDQEEPR
jgi:hypothetical protein